MQLSEEINGLRINWLVEPSQTCLYSIKINGDYIEQNIEETTHVVQDFAFDSCVVYQIEVIPIGVTLVGEGLIKIYKKSKSFVHIN